MSKLARMILVASGTLLFCSQANAATDTVVVTGTIAEVISVTITPNSNSFGITAGVAVTDQDIATIAINSNDPDGYDVTLEGTHATSIIQNAAADESMVYTVKYNGGAAIPITTTPTNVENVTTQTAGSENRSLTLSIAAGESIGRSAEAYTTTLTVEILGK